MLSTEYINQQIKAGYKVHLNKGVWWQKIAPFFYKPVIRLMPIVPGQAYPSRLKSFLGYSHVVTDKKFANGVWSVMLLSEDRLKTYDFKSISSSKRARVRKGLKHSEVRRIENIESVLEEMRDICISTAKRTRHGLPPEYYIKNYEKWCRYIKKEFSLSNREWWGVFFQDKLIAYFYAYMIDHTMFIVTAKSHTDFLDKCPNDCLLFKFLKYCRDLADCRQVIFGDWAPDTPTLNKFKEKYGFKKVDLPVYKKYNPIILSTKRLLKFKR